LLIYVAVLLAVGMSPLVRWIERRRAIGRHVSRPLAILSIYVLVLGAVAGIALAMVPMLVEQAQQLYASLPSMLEQVQRQLREHGITTRPLTMGEIMREAPMHGDFFGKVLFTALDVIGGVFGIVTILVLAYYLLVEADSFFRGIVRLFAPDERPRLRRVAAEITEKVSSWLGAQLLLGTIIGVSTAIGLSLIGAPYALVLALIAGIGELIPILGPVLAAIPGIALALTVSWQTAAAVAVYYFLQQQLENHILVPKLMGQRLGTSAAGVIMAMLLGGSILGIVGVILAIPTMAIVQVIAERVIDHDA
jgi:predicted PurR-regulated permease PerM